MAILKRKNRQGKHIGWQVLIDRADPIDGKRKRLTVGTYLTKKEAEKAERDALTHQERGTLVDPKNTTVAVLLEGWLANKAGSISPNSHADYEIAIRRHLNPAFGSVKAQRLNPSQVQAQYSAWQADHEAYQAWKATPERESGNPPSNQGMSPRMVHRCHIVLSQALALAQAVRFGILTRNVCSDVTKPSLSCRKPDVWTPGETYAFLATARSDTLAPLWCLLALEGMRRGEALGLRWSDVNWDSNRRSYEPLMDAWQSIMYSVGRETPDTVAHALTAHLDDRKKLDDAPEAVAHRHWAAMVARLADAFFSGLRLPEPGFGAASRVWFHPRVAWVGPASA